MGASQNVPQYFAGALDMGEEADWERAAKAVSLLQANGVRIAASPAVVRGGRAHLPFLAATDGLPQALGGGPDPRRAIEALCPYRLEAYKKVDPRKAGANALGAMAKLSGANSDGQRCRAKDIEPLRAGSAGLGGRGGAFDGLVGLGRQREALEKLATLVAKHGRGAVDCLHMAFMGPAGTGKTEMARRLLAHLDACGVTDGSGTFVQATAADLVARYVGQTPSRTRAVVERAYGGLLFIDEAYALLDSSDYGQEAVDTLVEMLEDDRSRLVCVVAGYERETEELLARNPGLRDRLAIRLKFEGYSTPELVQIFGSFAARHGFSLADGAEEEAARCIDGLRGKRGFAHARTARRLYDRSAIECACRCDEPVIAAEDIRAAYAQPDLGGDAPVRRVGF